MRCGIVFQNGDTAIKFRITTTALAAAIAFSQPVFASFCEDALVRSDVIAGIHRPQVHARFSRTVLERAGARGISQNELEWMIQRSRIKSLEINGEHFLPLFRTVRSEEYYKDYVFIARLTGPFIPGKTVRLTMLTFDKVSERGQKGILTAVAEQQGIRGLQLPISHLDLGLFGFDKAPVFVNISPGVRTKLLFKHNIDQQMIAQAFRQKPSEIRLSDHENGSVEVFYHGEKITLKVVLMKGQKQNTTSLVTSYFTHRRDLN